jgi:ribosomal protein S18 acetylase RimI-like enzyme
MKSDFSLAIRRVELSEAEKLRALAERTFRDAWQTMNDPTDFEAYCRENFALEKLRAELAQPDEEFYFALFDEKPIAYLKLNIGSHPKSSDEFEGKTVQVHRIYVLQDFQSQRIGEKLLQFSEARALELGAKWLWLTVWQEAPRAIRFYEKNGFEICGTETFWLGDDAQKDWLMRKKL